METKNSQTNQLMKHTQDSENNLPELYEQNKPIFISEYCKSLTIVTAQKSTQISYIKFENGAEYLEKLIIKVITEALKIIPNDLKTDNVIYFTKLIVNEYWYWKIDDIVLCLKNGILGKYGKIYGQFSVMIIIEWLNEYQKEKDNYYENKLLDDHSKYGQRDTRTERNTSLFINRINKNNCII